MFGNPFIARSGLDPKVFVGRDDDLRFFEGRLANAIENRCEHYVITGTWGIGKTVLLRQMKILAQGEGAWALYFAAREFRDHEGQTDFARHLLQMMASELPIQPRKRSSKLKSLGAGALGFSFSFAWSSPDQERKDPQLFLRDGLLEMHEHAVKNGARALIVMIDDVQNFSTDGQYLTLLRNVLSDERIIGKTNMLVVLASTDQGWKPFLKRDHPVGRLFLPRRSLGVFRKEEMIRLIEESLAPSGVRFEDAVKDRVFDVTGGHVFEVQALCGALFDQQIKGVVSRANWETALQHTLLALADAQFAGMIERASQQEMDVLKLLASTETPLTPKSVADTCPAVRNPAQVLKRLVEKGLADHRSGGQYYLADRLFCHYLGTL